MLVRCPEFGMRGRALNSGANGPRTGHLRAAGRNKNSGV